MTVIRINQDQFTGGEVTPLSSHRLDNDTVRAGLERCRNMIPLMQGAATKRPGTRFLQYGKKGRLIPYAFSSEQEYMLLLSDQRIEFLKDGESIQFGSSAPTALEEDTFDSDMDGWLDTSYDENSLDGTPPSASWSSGSLAPATGGGKVALTGTGTPEVGRATKITDTVLQNNWVYGVSFRRSTGTAAAIVEITDSALPSGPSASTADLVDNDTSILVSKPLASPGSTATMSYYFANGTNAKRYVSIRKDGLAGFSFDNTKMEPIGIQYYSTKFAADLDSWSDVSTVGAGVSIGEVTRQTAWGAGNVPNTCVRFRGQRGSHARLTRRVEGVREGDGFVTFWLNYENNGHLFEEFFISVGTTPGAADVYDGAAEVGTDASQHYEGSVTTANQVVYLKVPFSAPSDGDYYFTLDFARTSSLDAATDISVAWLSDIIVMEDITQAAYFIDAPWLEAELDDVGYCQAVKTMFFAHNNYTPRALRRNDSTDTWELVEVDTLDGPYMVQNLNESWTLTPGATTGTINLTSSQALFESNDAPRRWFRLKHGNQWGACRINSVLSPTSATATVSAFFPLGSAASTSEWSPGAFGGEQGYPARCAFYDSRMFWGRTEGQEDGIFASVINGVSNEGNSNVGDTTSPWSTVLMSPTLTDGSVTVDRGFNRNIQASRVESLVPGPTLGILTAKSEWELSSGDRSNALGPLNVKMSPLTQSGTPTLPDGQPTVPVRLDSTTLFVGRGGKSIRELSYNRVANGFQSPDISLLSEHLVRSSQIKAMAYCQSPHNILWVALNNGDLLSLTYDTNNNVYGWAKHTLGGAFQGGVPIIISLASIYNTAKEYDELYMLVRRTLNGEDEYTIETLGPAFIDGDLSLSDAHFVDCGVDYDGESTTSIPALHLEGESVSVVAGGVQQDDVTAGSSVTVPATTRAHIGYSYQSYIETLEAEVGLPSGTIMHRPVKGIRGVYARVFRSGPMKVGYRDTFSNSLELVEAPYQTAHDPNAQDTAPFTGTTNRLLTLHPKEQTKTAIVVESSLPLPLTITALSYTLDIDDKTLEE